jgi:ribosome biogenesis GTPase
VDELLPRSSELVRPPVANVNVAVLVFSVVEPDLNTQLLDKFLVHAENAGIPPLIVLSKTDALADRPDSGLIRERVEEVRRLYDSIGYETLTTSARLGEGIEPLRERLRGSVAVVAGQSGVGKSSLLNRIVPGLTLETSEISRKLGRGRHTTRHVELVPLPGGGWIADTPGFSQLDFGELGVSDLGRCFREFRALAGGCRFRGCTHVREPGCAVREAKERGEIAESRYAHYVDFLAEMNDKGRRY